MRNVTKKGNGLVRSMVVGLTSALLLVPAAMAQTGSGNTGADKVTDGINDLIPVVTTVIGVAIALGFVVMAASIAWKVFKKFWG